MQNSYFPHGLRSVYYVLLNVNFGRCVESWVSLDRKRVGLNKNYFGFLFINKG